MNGNSIRFSDLRVSRMQDISSRRTFHLIQVLLESCKDSIPSLTSIFFGVNPPDTPVTLMAKVSREL